MKTRHKGMLTAFISQVGQILASALAAEEFDFLASYVE